MEFTDKDIKYMELAIIEAKKSLKTDDVPVGAVVVYKDEVIGTGHNTRELNSDVTGHAEINALREASKKLTNWQLNDAVMYVTLEPCAMCTCSLVSAHISKVIYGADDNKKGACGSLLNLAQFPGFDHDVSIRSGLLKEPCKKLIKDFFQNKRKMP